MASGSGELPDPSVSERANYDYQSEDVARPALAEDLSGLVDGEVRFDGYSRQLYATDASIYEVMPIGVVRPTSTADVSAVVEYCHEREIPVLPRGGATSLAGQTTNEAVVLDFKAHMNDFLDVDPDTGTARAQPGITLAELNDWLAPHDLKYAPDPAWGDKSVLGGCIGNNSTGAHSLKYEKADKYTESLEVVLSDGTVTEFGWMTLEELEAGADPEGDLEARFYAEVLRILDEDAAEIRERFPDLKRNVSGYNFDVLLEEAEDRGEVNVARLFAGSEGTLGVITEAEIALEPIPETTAIAMLAYEDVLAAMSDVAPILEHDPSAVEVMDDVFLELAREREKFRDLVEELPDGTDSTLLVEFYADSEAEAQKQVADLIADRVPETDAEVEPSEGAAELTAADPEAFAAMEAYSPERQTEFWEMRKAGLPILLSDTGDARHWPYIEDTAVPAEHLPEYVAEFQDILDDLDTFAAYYAHAGPGVLHIRPLVNLKTQSGVDTMVEITDRVTDLVMKYDGSVSGEHGDGRARTEWNEKFYGEQLWTSFRSLKASLDPKWLMNPGQVCGDEDGPTDMTENLRFDPEYQFEVPFDPELNWPNENGFQGMTELCHGCAGCASYQDTTGGVMCPTYRAAEEEITSTRGRANMLRSAMNGNLPEELFSDEFVHEVLDLCISCKGCKHDCPSGVDMAKLKVEVKHEYHKREGKEFRDQLFAHVDRLAGIASALDPLPTVAMQVPGVDTLLERTVGIAKERTLPTFDRRTFQDWFEARGGSRVPASEADRKAIVFPDTYTNYSRQQVGKAAVAVLEAAGVHVAVAERSDSGRPAYSKSFVDVARETARENIRLLTPRVRKEWDVVCIEPSDAVMLQDDYLDLLEGSDVRTLAGNTYGVMEYLDTFDLVENLAAEPGDELLTYHGHCHQKGTGKAHHARRTLERAGFAVDELDSGCCGMAGTFGYEAEHHSMSQAVGELVFDQVRESPGEELVAPGASCRTQFEDSPVATEQPPHPIEKLAEALA